MSMADSIQILLPARLRREAFMQHVVPFQMGDSHGGVFIELPAWFCAPPPQKTESGRERGEPERQYPAWTWFIENPRPKS
jgi:hypothetical protein